ncbi:hypothetical protein EPH95_03690 [Salicibibacter halophilus]|uniref:Sigma-70 family RNA polymerase sigma factor n=1 Tax=Salicibibacter halophilus TaxID=2502791 RepID=A0A514LF08_9BACI|nr:hypothetical protein [Salicibibacter halophilus]QDI90393.1 hypothetical protein EPH95_03690 [Salicibibacter halophilus]
MKKRTPTLEDFIRSHAHFFQDPLVQAFMEKNHHWGLLRAAIEQEDEASSDLLNQRFEMFYLKIRMMQYITTLSRFYVNSYDQSKRKQMAMLMLDAPNDAAEEEGKTRGDLVPAEGPSSDDAIAREVRDLLPTAEMQKTFQSFSQKKQVIVYIHLFFQARDQEIAEMFGCTPQNVSKMRRMAFAQLRGG